VRSPFLWRHLALLAGLVANGVLSGVSLVKGPTAVRAWALPLGIAVRAATFVYLLLSLFAVLLGLEVFTALEWEYDWRPHDAWPQIQPGMTRRQVVALLGPPQSHIRFEYGYLLWPLAYSQGTLTFTGDPATLHDPLVDTIPDDAQVLEKTPETTSRDWLPGGFPAWLWDHVRRSSQPLSAATLVLLLALSLMPGRLRDGWYTWSLYLPVMAGVAATLYELATPPGWRFDQFFLLPLYLLILGTWAIRLRIVATSPPP